MSWVPPSAIRVNLGKKFARATPISSLAAAVRRSLSATSGRRRNTSAGTARGRLGNGSGPDECGTENDAAALPTKAAMEFSRRARLRARSEASASAELNWFWARSTSTGDAIFASRRLCVRLQRGTVDGDRIGIKLELILEASQIDVVARQFRVEFEPRVGERGGARLGCGVRRFDDVAHPPPDVELVGGLRPNEIVAVVGRLIEGPKRPVRRLLVRGEVRNPVDLRVRRAQGGVRARDGFVIRGDRGGKIGIGRVDLRLEIVERPVVEGQPPHAAGGEFAAARRGVRNLGGSDTDGGA